MHEYDLMQKVIAAILAELTKPGVEPQGEVLEVALKLGALAVHSEAATRLAYEILTKGTILENSRLRLTILPVTLACPRCGHQGPLPEDEVNPHEITPLAECPQCGAVSPVQGERGVAAIELRWE